MDDDPTAELASDLRHVVARLHRRMRQELRGAATDLTPARRAALYSVEQLGPITIGDLATAEQTHPSTVTRLVDALEAAGLVLRSVEPEDRRIVKVSITPDGRDRLDRGRDMSNALFIGRLERLSLPERRRLAAVMPLLRRLIDE